MRHRCLLILSLLFLGAWADYLPPAAPRLRPNDLRFGQNFVNYRGGDYFFRGAKALADESGGEMFEDTLASAGDGIYTGRKIAFECVITSYPHDLDRWAAMGTLPDNYSVIGCDAVHGLSHWQVLIPNSAFAEIERFEHNQRVDQLGLRKSFLFLTETDRANLLVPTMYYRAIAWTPLGRPINWDTKYRDATMMGKLVWSIYQAANQ